MENWAAMGIKICGITEQMPVSREVHNMIVEDEGPSSLNTSFDDIGVLADTSHGSMSERNEYINNRYDQLHDPVKYNQLQVDLIHHH